jgi:hypothetical protein
MLNDPNDITSHDQFYRRAQIFQYSGICCPEIRHDLNIRASPLYWMMLLAQVAEEMGRDVDSREQKGSKISKHVKITAHAPRHEFRMCEAVK